MKHDQLSFSFAMDPGGLPMGTASDPPREEVLTYTGALSLT